MKFNGDLTALRSDLTGLRAYRRAAAAGRLEAVPVPLLEPGVGERAGCWRKQPVSALAWSGESAPSDQPLEVEGLTVGLREPVIDELTRHHQTEQAFFSVDLPIVVIAAGSDASGEGPDRSRIDLIPCAPGELVVLERGVWHSLPFSFAGTATCLTIVNRLPRDQYHDVRDLPAHGWFGDVQWPA